MSLLLAATFPVTAFDYHWQKIIYGWTAINPIVNGLGIVLARYAPEIWAGVFLLLWFWPPLRQNRARRAVVYATVAGVLALMVSVALSHGLPYRPRPFVLEPHLVRNLIAHPPDTSFPSDHAAGSFAFATALFFAGRRDGWWGVLLAVLVSLARVLVGVHWPTDVMAGGAIGVVAGVLVLAARKYLEGLVRVLFTIFRFQPERRYRFR